MESCEKRTPQYFQLPALRQVKCLKCFATASVLLPQQGAAFFINSLCSHLRWDELWASPGTDWSQGPWCSRTSSGNKRHGAVELQSCRSTPPQRVEHPPICHAAAHAVVLCLIKI